MASELTRLGERPRVEDGGVSWDGDALSVMRANLWLRSASRVVVRVARFKATAFFELEKRAKKIPWKEFIGDRDVEFRVTARKSRLYHSGAIAERLRLSALGSRLAAKKRGPKAESRESRADAQLFIVRVVNDQFEISVDTSGELLHLRGYRLATGKAPLRETLGAALLLAADWNGGSTLVDPFCGSGTIPIEAAMIARRIAPGLHRRFAFMDWPDFDERAWRQTRDRARSAQAARSAVALVGSDRDAGAIASATANAERAGVAADVEFAVRSVSDMPSMPGGMIATNPPYGVRASPGSDVRNLYAQLGKIARVQTPGGRLVMYVPERKLARQVGLTFDELYRTTNGGIKIAAVAAPVPESAESSRL